MKKDLYYIFFVVVYVLGFRKKCSSIYYISRYIDRLLLSLLFDEHPNEYRVLVL